VVHGGTVYKPKDRILSISRYCVLYPYECNRPYRYAAI
jgi:hypothetical protein